MYKKLILLTTFLILIYSIFFFSKKATFVEINTNSNLEKSFVQTERDALPIIKKEENTLEFKNYLLGKFDPSKNTDFILLPNKTYLRKETYDAFLEMQKSASLEKIDLKIVSATRTFEDQKNIWNKKWTGVTLVNGQNLKKTLPDELARFKKILEYSSVPGTSRHHFGTDIDINSVETTYFKTKKGKQEYAWLEKNASTFGFCQTYTEKNENRKTGYEEESWHWSYTPISKELTQKYKEIVTEKDLNGFLGYENLSKIDIINDYVLGIDSNCL